MGKIVLDNIISGKFKRKVFVSLFYKDCKILKAPNFLCSKFGKQIILFVSFYLTAHTRKSAATAQDRMENFLCYFLIHTRFLRLQVDPYIPPEPTRRLYPPVPDRRADEALDFYMERDRCLAVGYYFFCIVS